MASDDYDLLPSWVQGQRAIYVKICTDGILISHRYPDTLPEYKPAQPDEDKDIFKINVFFQHTVVSRYRQNCQ